MGLDDMLDTGAGDTGFVGADLFCIHGLDYRATAKPEEDRAGHCKHDLSGRGFFHSGFLLSNLFLGSSSPFDKLRVTVPW